MNPELAASTARTESSAYRVPGGGILSNLEYRALVEHSPVMIWRAGLDTRCDYLNETWLSFTGRTLEQEVGEGWAEGVHPDDVERCVKFYRECFQARKSFEMEYRLRRYDGEYRWIFDRGTPFFDAGGAFKGFVGSCVDIDDRRRAQAEREHHHQETVSLFHELREREAKIRRLVDSNIVGIVFSDRESQVIEANDAFLEMLAYTRHDVQAGRLRWRDMTPPEWSAISERAAVQIRETGICDVFEKEYYRSDGGRVAVLVGVAAYGDSPNETVAFVLDLSDRKRAEQERERLRQAQADLVYMSRILTMGELAGSIAHDIKQPITAAQVSADTCVRWLTRIAPDLDEVRAAAARMSIEVRRASRIIDRVRSLYTRSAPRRDVVDVNDLVREMAALLEHEATVHDVSVETDLEPSLPHVIGDRVQLQQVLLNLMLNAIEAMKGAAGAMKISSRGIENEVQIAVADCGIGLPMEHADRIFDAFFTTKPNGTGMGLSISRAIIEAHGGQLSASANSSRGATFQFTLPNEAE
ncbi:MAG TPA: PAS domain S-box protein [Gemmatimonadaceae bacterium]|nr:PAS domain S-box protein [Gemmatimonadaceae bacterium]